MIAINVMIIIEHPIANMKNTSLFLTITKANAINRKNRAKNRINIQNSTFLHLTLPFGGFKKKNKNPVKKLVNAKNINIKLAVFIKKIVNAKKRIRNTIDNP